MHVLSFWLLSSSMKIVNMACGGIAFGLLFTQQQRKLRRHYFDTGYSMHLFGDTFCKNFHSLSSILLNLIIYESLRLLIQNESLDIGLDATSRSKIVIWLDLGRLAQVEITSEEANFLKSLCLWMP